MACPSTLSAGHRIEVNFSPQRTANSSPVAHVAVSEQWYTGEVLTLEERYSGDVITVATIQYDATSGFPYFRQEVLVSPSRGGDQPTLRCMLTGKGMLWRPATTSGSVEGELEGEEMELPVEAPVGSKAMDNVNTTHNKGEIGESLERRVAYLEAAISVQRDALSRLHGGVPMEAVANFDRPLYYIRMRLNELLQQSLRGVHSRGKQDASIVMDRMSCNADCSLAEFESLSLHVLSNTNHKTVLTPPLTPKDIPRLHEDFLRIEFVVLNELFAVLGMTSTAIAGRTVFKCRRTRDGSSVNACRIIGHLLCPGRKEPEPMCITVAHAVTEELAQRIPDQVPVIIREDTTWSHLDKQYEYPLLLQFMSKARCEDLRKSFGNNMSACNEGKRRMTIPAARCRGGTDNPSSFILQWERCNKRKHDLIYKNDVAQEVPGRLHLELPVVSITDPDISAEIKELCDGGKLLHFLE